MNFPSQFRSMLIHWMRWAILEAGIFAPTEWAEILGVNIEDIGEWIHGTKLPTCEMVWQIRVVLETAGIAPSAQTSLVGEYPVQKYSIVPIWLQFCRDFARVPIHTREALLLRFSAMCMDHGSQP